MPTINPYLTFKDQCEAAFEFYRSVFGGEFAVVMRMTDLDIGMPIPPGAENLIMHIAYPIGSETMLMGSDAPEGFGPPMNVGNNFSIAVGVDSEEEADRIYNGLAAGGTAVMPMSKAPWGDYFGMLTDKFDIQWMVSYDYGRKG